MRTKAYKTADRLPKQKDANADGHVYVQPTPDHGFVRCRWDLVTTEHFAWTRAGGLSRRKRK